MPRVPLSRAQPGQKLLQPVTTAAGVVLVQAGAELSATLIARLGGLGIDTLVVASGENAAVADDAVADGMLGDRVREVEARFAGHEHDPRMMAIKDMVVRQLSRRRGADA